MAEPANTEVVEDAPVADQPDTPPVEGTPVGEDDFDKDRALRTIRQQRESEKQLKAELAEAKAAQEELRQIKDAEKSELERAQQKAEEAEATVVRTRKNLEDANLKVALSGKVADVELAATALKERGLTFNDDGSPEGLDEAVESLLTDKPLLRAGEAPQPKAPNIDAGAGANNDPPPELTPDELEKANAMKVTPEHFEALKGATTYDEWLAVNEKFKSQT